MGGGWGTDGKWQTLKPLGTIMGYLMGFSLTIHLARHIFRFLSPLYCVSNMCRAGGSTVTYHDSTTCAMPPLCRKLLNQLDDADQSFKCTRLEKYLRDASIEFPSPVSESESESDVSSISSISSVSGVSSLSSLDSNISHATLVRLSHSDLMALHYSIVQAEVDEFFHEIQAEVNKFQHENLTSRVLRRNPEV